MHMGKGSGSLPAPPLLDAGDVDIHESGVDAPSGVEDGEKCTSDL